MKHRNEHIQMLMGAIGVSVCFIVGFSQQGGWHDTAEFAAVGRLMTTSHSPGHPLYTILSSGWVNVFPFGSVAFRSLMFSGFCCVASYVILLCCVHTLKLRLKLGLVWLAAGIVAPPVFIQAVRPEVYALALFLVATATWLWILWWRTNDQRYVVALGFAIGLGGTNHSYIALIFLPIVLISFVHRRIPLKTLMLSGLSGITGLSAYVLLVIRSHASEFGWGTADSLSQLWRMISARDWTKSIAENSVTPVEQVIETCVAFIQWLGPVGFVICFSVLTISLVNTLLKRTVVGMYLFGFALSFLVFRGLIEVDVHNPDLMGYLAPGLMLALLGALIEVDRWSTRGRGVFHVVALSFLVSMLFASSARQERGIAERYAQQVLSEAPLDGVLLVSNYSTWFWTWYLRGVEGQRPDLAVVFRGRLEEPWLSARLQPRYPDVVKRLTGYPTAFLSSDVAWEPGVLLP
ncbi:MAG: protein O-mannosyl-transferase family, partial [Bradymonadia bacterium]